MSKGFKPYYNWNTFNTKLEEAFDGYQRKVLNLIITGIPSIRLGFFSAKGAPYVLNLIITGIPSIPGVNPVQVIDKDVLNLIITGIPSIRISVQS